MRRNFTPEHRALPALAGITLLAMLAVAFFTPPATAGGVGRIRAEIAKQSGINGDISPESVQVGTATNGTIATGDLVAGISGVSRLVYDQSEAFFFVTNSGNAMKAGIYADIGMGIASDRQLVWSTSTTHAFTSPDVGLERSAAGALQVTDGASGGGALNVGTTTDGAAVGDFSAGTTGARRISWDESAGSFSLYGASGIAHVGMTGYPSLDFGSSTALRFSSSIAHTGTKDVGIDRDSAGVLQITNGSTGGGALRVGTYAGAAAAGDLSAGQTGAGTLLFDSSEKSLVVGGGTYPVVLDSDTGEVQFGASVKIQAWGSTALMARGASGTPVVLIARQGQSSVLDADTTLAWGVIGYRYTDAAHTATRTYTLPTSPLAGYHYKFSHTNASYTIRIDPGTGSKIVFPGSTLADDKYLQIDTRYVSVTLEALSDGDWLMTSSTSNDYATDFTQEP